MSRRSVAGMLIGLVAAVLVLGLQTLVNATQDATRLGPFDTLEWKTYDWRLRRTARPELARRNIVLVEIDEYSLQNLEPLAGRWPWPRIVHASLINFLSRAPARIVAYDVTFGAADTRLGFRMGEETLSGSESDTAFADAVRAAGNVILLVDATFAGEKVEDSIPPSTGLAIDGPGPLERSTLLLPYPELARAAAGFGHNYFALDSDGPLRHTVPFVRTRDVVVPSLGLSAALKAAGLEPRDVAVRDGTLTVGTQRWPLATVHAETADGRQSFWWRPIAFRGPALLDDLESRPYSSYAFYDLLYSEEQIRAGETPKVDPAVFKDAIVLVGATASGLFDVFETPFSRGRMPGIQVHAAVADDLLSGRSIVPVSTPTKTAMVVGLALAVGLTAASLPAWWGIAGTLGLVSLFSWATVLVFARGTWLNVTEPVASAAVALLGGVAYQYFVEGREKRKVSQLFGRYVSRDVFNQLLSDPSRATLGGQRRDMTVLFSDVRGFTTLTEQGAPEDIVRTLNEYFSRMVDVVFRHEGTVDKFVGDLVMALFGAPLDDPDHADHAVGAALDMVAELEQLNARWQAEGRAVLDIGIGINTGPMIAGNIGSESIMSYTVIGDAVNLGSRLESLNKQYGTRIIISETTKRQLKQSYRLRPLGDVVVKGKSQSIAIFEVVGRDASHSAMREQALTSNEGRE